MHTAISVFNATAGHGQQQQFGQKSIQTFMEHQPCLKHVTANRVMVQQMAHEHH